MNKFEALQHYFGHHKFLDNQEYIINNILCGNDVLCVMPTGAGKSLCYQLPALLFDGITIVISPLKALMKDQVASLKRAKIKSDFINSSLSKRKIQKVYKSALSGKCKLLYVSPERLESSDFISFCSKIKISFVVIDEAHCVSQWGNSFRPEYRKISDFASRLPTRPVVGAFTATATKNVIADITKKLNLFSPVVITSPVDRKNLVLKILHPQDKDKELVSLVKENKGKNGIIYCLTRKNVDYVAKLLRKKGFSVAKYHAGLSDKMRLKAHRRFLSGRKKIMVATNAFGMGIDKSDISFVIHYNFPLSLEEYYQQVGRAGRDGKKSDCILLYSDEDVSCAKFLLGVGENEQLSENTESHKKLLTMLRYCKTNSCLKNFICVYFGEKIISPCMNCENCKKNNAVKVLSQPTP